MSIDTCFEVEEGVRVDTVQSSIVAKIPLGVKSIAKGKIIKGCPRDDPECSSLDYIRLETRATTRDVITRNCKAVPGHGIRCSYYS